MAEKKTNSLTPELAKKQDEIVQSVIGNKGLAGFQKAHIVSAAIVQLREMMTPEYMAPIMAMQSNKLGFKSDKDLAKNPNGNGYVKGPGYPMDVVRECVIEAVLSGLQVTGNEFNIIGGNMYPTKEGMYSKLRQVEGLKFKVFVGIPEVAIDIKSATFKNVKLKWSLNGGAESEETIEIPMKIDSYTSVDAMQGKAKRKAYAWLYENVTGETIADGEVDDIPMTVVSSEPLKPTSLPEFTSAQFEKAKAKNATVEQIRELYSLSPKVEAEYLAYVGAKK